jgi:hypothetical protein
VKYFEQWFAYFSFCLSEPMQAPVCGPFWNGAMVAAFACVAVAALVVAWKIAAYLLKLAAALRAEKERARVDHAAIAARTWDSDKAYRAEVGGSEVERQIREAVDERRAANKPPSPIITDK